MSCRVVNSTTFVRCESSVRATFSIGNASVVSWPSAVFIFPLFGAFFSHVRGAIKCVAVNLARVEKSAVVGLESDCATGERRTSYENAATCKTRVKSREKSPIAPISRDTKKTVDLDVFFGICASAFGIKRHFFITVDFDVVF